LAFSIVFSASAADQLKRLEKDRGLAKRLKAVRKTLGRLEIDPRHPGLQSHKVQSLSGPSGEEAFEVYAVYAEQNTPAAYRVFWYYGPTPGKITILAITSHP
jgi:hypothetical protein